MSDVYTKPSTINHKWREWWICQTPGSDGDAYDSDPETWEYKHGKRKAIHVIEVAALEAARAEIAQVGIINRALASEQEKDSRANIALTQRLSKAEALIEELNGYFHEILNEEFLTDVDLDAEHGLQRIKDYRNGGEK